MRRIRIDLSGVQSSAEAIAALDARFDQVAVDPSVRQLVTAQLLPLVQRQVENSRIENGARDLSFRQVVAVEGLEVEVVMASKSLGWWRRLWGQLNNAFRSRVEE